MKLNVKLFLGFLVGSLALVFILAFVFYNDLFKILQNQKLEEKQQELILRRDATEHLLGELESSTKFLGNLSSLQDYSNASDTNLISIEKTQLENELLSFLKLHERYNGIVFIDEKGQEIIKITIDENKNFKPTPYDKLINTKNTYYFQNTIELNKNEIFVSFENLDQMPDVNQTATDELNNENKDPVLAYSTPIFNQNDQIKGIIILKVLPDFVLEGVINKTQEKKISNNSAKSEINAEVIITDNNGFYLHHPDVSKEWSFLDNSNEKIFKDFPALNEILQLQDSGEIHNESNNTFILFSKMDPYSDAVKKIHMGSYTHGIEEAKKNITENNENIYWIQVLKIEKSEILNKVNILFFKTLTLILLILMFFVISMMLFLQRMVVDPIDKIIIGADKIKKGNLDYRLSLGNRKDEFGDLANEFNSMSAVLKRYKETMELKIDERTADLEKFRNAIETSHECISITDITGKILYANNAVEKTTGFELNEIIGKNVEAINLWGGLTEPSFYENLWKTIKDDKQVFFDKVKNKNKDGVEYNTLLSITPMLNKKGEILYFFSIQSDLSNIGN